MTHAGGVQDICRVLEEKFGWSFPSHRLQEVEDAAWAAARETELADLHALARSLVEGGNAGSRVHSLLTSSLTVSETCFFRDALMFRLLEEQVLPKIIQRGMSSGRRVRIWSAGCCTGEEAYSLAIALLRCLPSAELWDLEILGTDLNPISIAHAKSGVYRERAFRDAPSWFRKTFFTPIGPGSFEIKPEVRSKVRFLTHNLMSDLPPGMQSGQIDLLVCRNVLMYFSAEKAGGIIRTLRSALKKAGVLSVAPYETLRLRSDGFEPIGDPGGAFFQIEDASRVAAPVSPAAKPAGGRRVGRPGWRRLSPIRPGRTSYSPPQALEAAKIPMDPLREVRTLAGEGRLWEALDLCDECVACNRLEPEAHYLRATILLEGGLIDEAAGALRQTLYLRPDFVQAHLTMATIARIQGRPEDAGRMVARARQILASRPSEEPVPATESFTAAALLAMLPAVENTGL